MIFAPSYSRRVDVLDAAIRPVPKKPATWEGDGKDQPREDPPKWSISQMTPPSVVSPRIDVRCEASAKDRVRRRYTTKDQMVGLFLSVVA